MLEEVAKLVFDAAKDFGLQIEDVRIRRADLPTANSEAIFRRMQTERQQEAAQFRAEGEEQSRRIRAESERERTILLANAERTGEILRGEGDARKNKILADAYSLDEEFFDFLRTMQACKDTFGDTEMSMVIAPGQVCEKFFGEIEIKN